jgi:adenylate cyclase
VKDKKVVLLLALVALLAPVLAIVIGETRAGRTVERRFYDNWFGIRGRLETPDSVVLVAIDVPSEESLGRYPWSRDWHSRLIRNLARAGARVVAFDATFADVAIEDPAQDTTLRRVVDSTGIVVLGAKTLVTRVGESFSMGLEEPDGVLNGAPIGIVDIVQDPMDGVIREYPILHEYPQGSVPQLGIQALMRFWNLPADALRQAEGGWLLGDRFIPRGAGNGMLINFVGPAGSVSTYSYSSVVDDAGTDLGEWDMDEFDLLRDEGRFQDRIVLVGTTIPEDQDEHPTSFREDPGTGGAILTPGVEIHAQAVATVLTGAHVFVLPRTLQYLWTFLTALMAVTVALRIRGVLGGILTVVLAAGVLYASWWFFSERSTWLWAFAPVLSLALAYTGSSATLYVTEQQKAKQIQGMFSHYLAASVVDQLIENPELLALGGEERVVSVLFSDVADFSTISEKLTPTQLVELLNEYLTAMVDIITRHGGIVDKFVGDAIMAEFGVPLPLADHALRACNAALAMNAELGRLRGKWAAEGRPELFARVGINTGLMLVGNMGSSQISNYTVMGDAVNLASRLEGANKPYGTCLMVSEFTWEAAQSGLIGRELDRIAVKGKQQPVCVYEVIARRSDGVSPETTALIEEFARALALYQAARFQDALAAFQAIAARHPDDGPTALYVERCQEFLADPPPAGWDGVYRMKTK